MKKSAIGVMIVSLLLFAATTGILISMSKIDKQTEDTTTFYTATVIGVDITNTGKNISAEIHTNQSRYAFHCFMNDLIGNDLYVVPVI